MATADDFPPIELPRASDAVSRALVDGIRAGLAPVGSKLPKDSELARAFGVSRAGVREAFELLRQAGIVEMRRGHLGGVFVRSLVIPTELLTDRTSLVLEEVRQLLEARRAVETICATLATTRASEADIEALAELADGLLEAHDRPEDFIELDVRFHLRLASASGNEPLAEFLATSSGASRPCVPATPSPTAAWRRPSATSTTRSRRCGCATRGHGRAHGRAPRGPRGALPRGTAQTCTVTSVPIGVDGQICLAVSSWSSTQPRLCGEP